MHVPFAAQTEFVLIPADGLSRRGDNQRMKMGTPTATIRTIDIGGLITTDS
jgi:hypothetical protein